MPISNSYIPALIANLVVYVAMVSWTLYQYGGPWGRYHVVVLLVGGCAGLIVTLFIGTFTRRSAKPWPLWILGFASLSCWLAILFIMLALTPHAGDLVRVNP
ncbi:MAG: hypothetical protein ABSH48_13810 [Verrucomicrobiota bacterium]|jgi:hypothetical protein